jgi:polyhydroxybutyrate depolymerase
MRRVAGIALIGALLLASGRDDTSSSTTTTPTAARSSTTAAAAAVGLCAPVPTPTGLAPIGGLLFGCGGDAASTATNPTAASSSTTAAAAAAHPCEPVPTEISTQERIDSAAGAPRPGWYLRYVPAVTADPPALVVDLHGFVEGADIHARMSELAALAEREGFVLVTPQGSGPVPYWNSRQRRLGPPDLEFVGAVLDDVEAALCTDPRRVFVTGLSNGAFMSSTIGCELAARVAAIAPVAGVRFEPGCEPSRPMPVIAFHGTEDTAVRFDGGDPEAENVLSNLDFAIDEEAARNFAGIDFRPVPDVMADWAAVNGCAPEAVEESIGTDVVHLRWESCAGGADVELYRIDGGGHSWPGSEFSASLVDIIGATTTTISANELMWSFFEDHPLPAEPPSRPSASAT